MALHNVVIKTRVAALNVDSYNRTAVCASTIDNGCVFKLASKSTTIGERMFGLLHRQQLQTRVFGWLHPLKL